MRPGLKAEFAHFSAVQGFDMALLQHPFEVTLRLLLLRLLCYTALVLIILSLLQKNYHIGLLAGVVMIHHIFLWDN